MFINANFIFCYKQKQSIYIARHFIINYLDIKNYISSGILEAYCLGQLSNEDMIAVDQMAIQYEEINQEINRIFESLELYVSPVQNEPLSKNKVKVFNDIYKLDAGKGKLFPPLIETQTPFIEIKNWLDEQKNNYANFKRKPNRTSTT